MSDIDTESMSSLKELYDRIASENPSVTILKKGTTEIYFGRMISDPELEGALRFVMADAQRARIKGNPFEEDTEYEINLALSDSLVCFTTRAIQVPDGAHHQFLSPMSVSEIHKRQGLRLPVPAKHKLLLSFKGSKNQTFKCRVLDISPKGVRISVPPNAIKEVEEDLLIKDVALHLPSGDVVLNASIRYQKGDSAGLQFEETNDDTRLALQGYLAQLIRELTYGE